MHQDERSKLHSRESNEEKNPPTLQWAYNCYLAAMNYPIAFYITAHSA